MDAQIARDRCLLAMESTDDLETKRSLWKAARKFNQRMRSETGAAGRETAGPSLAALGGARGGREW